MASLANHEVVETTSRAAARAMQRFYAEEAARDSREPGVTITETETADGRTLYRIRCARSDTRSRAESTRPRPRPPSPVKRAATSKLGVGRPHSMSQPPFPTRLPKITLATDEAAAPDPSLTVASDAPRMLHPIRSIPALRTQITAIMPDSSGYYRAPGSAASTARAVSTPVSHASAHALSDSGDVLGRLLGWSSTPPVPDALAATAGEMLDATGLPADLVQELAGSQPSPVTIDSPADASAIATSTPTKGVRTSPRTPLSRSHSGDSPTSPFGDGVRIDTRRLRRDPSNASSLDSPKAEQPITPTLLEAISAPYEPIAGPSRPPLPRMREAVSSETIREPKASIVHAPYGNSAIFDAFQTLERPPSSVGALPPWPAPHARTASTSSLASSIGSAATAHHITVSSMPGDDPRFVIWGRRHQPRSPTPGSDGPHSKRWSSKARRASTTDLPVPASPASFGSDGSAHASSTNARILMAATVERWVAELTSKIDAELQTDFFLTYRTFLTPLCLLRLLTTRFAWALEPASSPEDEAGRRIVRVRTFVVVRYWLRTYFADDFMRDRALRSALCAWLNSAGKDPRLKDSPKDQQLIKSLKKTVRTLRDEFGPTSFAGKALAAAACRPAIPAAPGIPPFKEEMETLLPAAPMSTRVRHVGSEPKLGSVPESPPKLGLPGLAPAIVLDDDVDLEIDLVVDAPAADDDGPSDPTSPRTSPQQSLYVPVSPPRIARRSTGPASPGSPHASPSKRSGLPQPHSLASRTVTNTLGQLGRFKRMIKDRSPSPNISGAENGSDVEQILSSDMLCVAGSPSRGDRDKRRVSQPGQERFDSYMRSFSLRVPGGSDATSSTSPTSESGLDTPADSSSEMMPGPSILGVPSEVDDEDTARLPRLASNDGGGLGISGVTLHHQASSQTIKSEVSSTSRRLPRPKSRLSFGNGGLRAMFMAQATGRSRTASVQLDDIGLSDEDDDDSDNEDYGVVQRTLRKLPKALDVRRLTPASIRRNSVDTVSSYGQPTAVHQRSSFLRVRSFRKSVAPAASADTSGDAPGVVIVGGFVLDGLSSDEDEAGDRDAALRRLEGQIDVDKAAEKAKRVETQLEKSAAFLAGTYVPRRRRQSIASSVSSVDDGRHIDEDGQSDGVSMRNTDGEDSSLGNSSPATSVKPGDSPIMAPYPTPTEQAFSSQLAVPPSVVVQSPAAEDAVHVRALAPPRQPKHKPSVKRFFTLPRPASALSGGRHTPTPPPRPPLLPHHHCFILHFKTEQIASQFCLIERDLLANISWHDLVTGEWKERTGETEVHDWEAFIKMRAKQLQLARANGERLVLDEVQAVIARFNLVANWVGSEIVMTLGVEERAALVAKFIRLAFKCYRQSNFQTLTQIVHGLQLAAVERLRATWARVGKWEMRVFRDLKAFTSHLRNFRSLRTAIDTLISEWGPMGQDRGDIGGAASTLNLGSIGRSAASSGRNSVAGMYATPRQHTGGCVPFLGLFLRDLAICTELPTWLDPSSPDTPIDGTLTAVDPSTGILTGLAKPDEFDGLQPLPSSALPLKALVNVHKHRTLSSILQQVIICTEMANAYAFEPEPTLLRKCLGLRCLPPEGLISFSLQCER